MGECIKRSRCPAAVSGTHPRRNGKKRLEPVTARKRQELRTAADDYFTGTDTPQDFERLSKRLEDWSLYGGYESLEYFQVWEMSGHVCLPFPGAWVDQPTWIRQDFLTLLAVSRWHRFNEQLPSVPENVPNAENVA